MAGPDVQTSVCILLTRPLNVSLSSSSGQRWGLLLWRGSFDLNFKLQGSASSDVSWSAFHVKLFIRCLKKKRGCEWSWSWSHHYKPSPPTLRCRTRGTCAGTNEDLIGLCVQMFCLQFYFDAQTWTTWPHCCVLVLNFELVWNLKRSFRRQYGTKNRETVFFFSVCSEFYFALFIFKCLKLKVSQWNVFIRFHSPSHISFRKRPQPASLHSSCSSSSCFKVFFVFSWNTVSSPPLSAGRIIVPLD